MFKLLRYYSVASLVAVLATAVLLTWFYRQVAIQGIVQMVEQGNLTLARAAMNPIKPTLLEYLSATENFRPDSANPPPLPPVLLASINSLMQDRSVIRIKIFNRDGVVVFSTKPSQIGDGPKPQSGLHHRDQRRRG